MLTADTITDEQIRELRRQALASNDGATVLDTSVALQMVPRVPEARRRARARCAEVLNARAWRCPSDVPGCTEERCRHVAAPDHAPLECK